ncbi:craniofacial development protein 2-like [Daktulosphaira vitifoliae]|uniref:craniofacial development protein 2-like n=1 Tax=Daktulosphaira vitifoliae TaxID=58002 RepID=UPI0021A995AB|nr:craniofacial development protein 2-like [Daktulosphaira vitifoliae]
MGFGTRSPAGGDRAWFPRTWNVRTLLRPGRFEELKQQMTLKQLDILGVCETRWGDNGDFWRDKQGKNGVGILLNKEWRLGDDEIEQVYDSLDELLGITRDSDNVIIMGDFNAVVGEGQDNQIVGKHGLGTRNIRGERLVNFCKQNIFLVSNTMFEVPKRRLYTWVASGDTNRYQIDYVLAKSRFKNQIIVTCNYKSQFS